MTVEVGTESYEAIAAIPQGAEWDRLFADIVEMEPSRAMNGYGGSWPHCLKFCGALKQHHTGENMGAFPMLEQRFPGLGPVLGKLGEEHWGVARLQQDIEQLIRDYQPGTSDPKQLTAELERLTSELEAHFEFEERSIVVALNALGPAPAHLG